MARIGSANPAWRDARFLAAQCVPPLPRTRLALTAAIGHVLGEDLAAKSHLPPAHTAMMDGYAVCGDPPWTVMGQVHAGQAATTIDGGQALRVSTGAHIPAATAMVVPQEHAVVEDGIVVGMVAQPQRSNIRLPGDEARFGDIVTTAGVRVSPVIAAIAASCGYDDIAVFGRPVVDVIVTGDELTDAGPSKPGTVRDSLSMQVPAWIEWSGGTVGSVVRIHDSLGELLRAMQSARGHIMVVTGGSAHGPRDFGRPALTELGAELVIDEVDCKPGHPSVLAGLSDGRVVANIPGNPLAACVAFMTVVDPVITAMSGAALRDLRPAVLHEPISTTTTRILPVTVEHGVATPTEHRRPAMLRGVAAADALAVVEPGVDSFDCGLLPLPWQV